MSNLSLKILPDLSTVDIVGLALGPIIGITLDLLSFTSAFATIGTEQIPSENAQMIYRVNFIFFFVDAVGSVLASLARMTIVVIALVKYFNYTMTED
jgi:hypothetical protein